MRWTPAGRSRNLEDRRNVRPAYRRGGPVGCGGLILILVISYVMGWDPLALLQVVSSTGGTDVPVPSEPAPSTAEEERMVQFVSFVLDDAQSVWARALPTYGTSYRDAKLVLFRDEVRSACGFASSAAGPFYCPADEKVYIDLGFFEELERRFGAPGDFAQAYVLAHEIGHHVQKVLGIEPQVRQLQRQRPAAAKELSVLMELQADCLAGIWGSSTNERRLLETGDVAEGLDAASAIGDDRIQRRSTGTVHPESFTHGSSAQRVEWFRRGLGSGDLQACDTFGAAGM